ncbi:MAG: hypothetical protein RLZ53_818 [Actinomycetota bacterium]|jgi:hypothetical protein
MNPLWFLPSLVLGGFYAVSSGNWMLLVATVLMFGVSVLVSRKHPTPSGALVIAARGVTLGGKKLPTRNFLWSKALHKAVIEAIDELPRESVSYLTRDWRGGDADSFAVGLDKRASLAEGAGHHLVIGPTGSGKSELIHLALASLDSRVQVLVADYKGGAVLTECSGIAGVSDLDTDEIQKDFWIGIQQELGRREQELKLRGVASIEAAVRIGVGFPRLLIVVDEVVAAIRMCPASMVTLTAVATRGRSLGIHLLATSQSLVGIPRELLINLRNRLALAGTDEVEMLQLGFKQKFSGVSRNTKAALFSQDGQVESVEVPLGVRQAPRQVG